MEPSSATYWSNTITTQAVSYQGMNDLPLGQFFLSLLLVVALMLVLAWLAKRFGLAQKPTVHSKEDTIHFYSQFNAEQTLVLLEDEKGLHCIIYRGKTIELSAPLPQLVAAQALQAQGKKASARPSKTKTFQDILQKGLKMKRPQ